MVIIYQLARVINFTRILTCVEIFTTPMRYVNGTQMEVIFMATPYIFIESTYAYAMSISEALDNICIKKNKKPCS